MYHIQWKSDSEIKTMRCITTVHFKNKFTTTAWNRVQCALTIIDDETIISKRELNEI